MNKHLRTFLHRGLMFGGFGPIVTAIVYFIISLSGVEIALTATDFFTAIVSTYLLAFVHAGVSVFNEIEAWSIGKSLLFHLGALYVVYTFCYLINAWIPFNVNVLLIYTAVFILAYLAIWLTVYFITSRLAKRLTKSIKE